MGIGMRELVVVILCAAIFLMFLWPYGRILRRLGYSPWLSLLTVVPIANLVLLWVVAYAKWPALSRTS